LMQACASADAEANSEQACRDALDMGRELANWFGIDGRAGAAIAAPAGFFVALLANSLSPKASAQAPEDK